MCRSSPGLGAHRTAHAAGILAEVYLGAPPVFVLIGAIAMTASGNRPWRFFLKLKSDHGH